MKELDFDEFKPSSLDEWKKLVQKELGEKSYESIVWKDKNGLVLEPYLVASSQLPVTGEQALAISHQPTAKSWLIHEIATGTDVKEVNRMVLQSLNGGVNSIGINIAISSREDLDVVMKDVLFEYIAVHLRGDKNPLALAQWLVERANEKGISTKTLQGSLFFNAFDNSISDDEFLKLAHFSKEHFSLFKTLVVEVISLHQTGANAVEELSTALARGNDLLQRLTSSGISIDDASAMIQFSFSVGSSYFVEMAKLWAFRKLWAQVVEKYQPAHECSKQCFIYAGTSMLAQDKEDANSNLLRATTQAMSAILGGANAVCVTPHDGDLNNENSLRLARNVQHLLIEESYLNEALNAAEGSYYIEEIERQLTMRVMEHG
ncbi:MAG: methylmalonyl-CoA mutase family protein [Flavobacteriales bacterium]